MISEKLFELKCLFKHKVTYKLIRLMGGVPIDSSGVQIDYAKQELCNVSLFGMTDQILDLLSLLKHQQHSRDSIKYTLITVDKLMSLKPLSPLTGDDDEWFYNGFTPKSHLSNKRFPRVRKGPDGRAYDEEGKIFRGSDGFERVTSDSRVYIKFPYTPTTEYVEVNNEPV